MRGILLDLDNTLLDDWHATDEGCRAMLCEYAAADSSASASVLLDLWRNLLNLHWQRFEKGEVSFQEQRRCRVRGLLGNDLDDSTADAAFLTYQRAYESAWRLYPGASEFLDRTREVPKVIVTNGNREMQTRKIHSMLLSSYFVGIVTPDDCGFWKPSEEIFEAALGLLQLDAAECLMIGDDEAKDIEPARKLGMHVFHIRPGANLLDAIACA